MKKLVFSLVAMAAFSFANATEIKTGEPVKETEKKEIVTVENEPVKETEELKTVTCTVLDRDGNWHVHSYSFFFCWGGSQNGCIANAAKELGLVL